MRKFYKAIEDKIKAAGYMKPVSGEEIYDDICEELEDKEEGSYIFMSKKEEGLLFEYKIDVYEEDFNLAYLIIHSSEGQIRVDFDA